MRSCCGRLHHSAPNQEPQAARVVGVVNLLELPLDGSPDKRVEELFVERECTQEPDDRLCPGLSGGEVVNDIADPHAAWPGRESLARDRRSLRITPHGYGLELVGPRADEFSDRASNGFPLA
jgi:hypothetical protein